MRQYATGLVRIETNRTLLVLRCVFDDAFAMQDLCEMAMVNVLMEMNVRLEVIFSLFS